MTFASRILRPMAAALVLSVASPAFAQEISDAHLAAARSAISAIHATDQFDAILPQAADALKAELIQRNPNLTDLIVNVVDKNALALASRRADLEKEAALVYAKAFAEQELKDIAAFYSTETGKKLISEGPLATRKLHEAVDIWQNGLARDLAESVAKELEAAAPAQPAQPQQ